MEGKLGHTQLKQSVFRFGSISGVGRVVVVVVCVCVSVCVICAPNHFCGGTGTPLP